MIEILLAAIIVGAVTLYRLGLRPGMTAAVVALLAFGAAAVVPGIKLWVYLVAALAVAGMLTIGTPRMATGPFAQVTRLVRRGLTAWRKRPPGK